MPVLASFLCGLIFGAGLLISGMTDPQKVLGFLDLFGAWDATLAFVMAGAVAVSATGFAIARRRTAPAFSARFLWPDRNDIDAPLVGGAVLFGIGWGLAGICPGPALVKPRRAFAADRGVRRRDAGRHDRPESLRQESLALAYAGAERRRNRFPSLSRRRVTHD
ncbi:hypothetical protein ACVWW1_003805 [Bradyrhizobium sp. JR3.5]